MLVIQAWFIDKRVWSVICEPFGLDLEMGNIFKALRLEC